jgi:tetratricopeptide (TPR) repeat protein
MSRLAASYWLLVIGYWLFIGNTYALNLEGARSYLLKGDYKAAIEECENILATGRYSPHLDELYYILGLSYLKTNNLLRAGDVFEIITKEFRSSRFRPQSLLALADICFLKADYQGAKRRYSRILDSYPDSQITPMLYLKLAQVSLKLGLWQQAAEYKRRLNERFPLTFEAKQVQGWEGLTPYFTVQIGAFSKYSNARALYRELINKGYPVYIQETVLHNNQKVYRIRVGRFSTRREVNELEKELAREGYPTKIYP